jgi:hypothetical protein
LIVVSPSAAIAIVVPTIAAIRQMEGMVTACFKVNQYDGASDSNKKSFAL